jgi:hypothetical protein
VKNTHLVIIANKANKKLCRSLFSAYSNGYPAPHLPYFGKEFKKGWLDKAEAFYTYLENHVQDSDTVLMMDGYDVIYQLSAHVVIRRLARMPKVVFGADKLCYPVRPDEPACRNVPQSPLDADIYGKKDKHPNWQRPRWINAGTVFGQGGELREILKEVVDLLKKDYAEGRFGDDQAQYANVVTNSSNSFSWTTDTLSQLVQTMIWSEYDLTWDVNPDPQTVATVFTGNQAALRPLDLEGMSFTSPEERKQSFWADRPLLRNFRANTIPALLHYAGPWAKGMYDFWWPRLWFMQPGTFERINSTMWEDQQPGGAGIWANDQWLSWQDLCGEYDLTM